MNIDFTRPHFLFWIPLVFLFLFFTIRKKRSSRFQKNLNLSIRFVICLLLILALSGMNMKQNSKRTTTIFAVDLSASVKGAEENTKQFLTEAQNTITTKDEAGIICFGERAAVEQKPDKVFSLTEFHSFVNQEFTSISDALKLSVSLLPEQTRKRIVLVSDGNENKGDAIAQAKLLQSQQISVDVYIIGDEISQEVQMTEIKVPPYSNKNVEYEIEITIDSLIDTKSKIKLYKGNQLIVNEEAAIRTGQNKFVYTDLALQGGGVLYRGEIEPLEDTIAENNKAYAQCFIEDIPSVLIIEKENSAKEIKKILEGSQLYLVSVEAKGAPVAMEKLNTFDTVILADVPMEELPEEFASGLESYVKHTGGGVIVTGGEHSYALGDYYNTPLEEILPVEMELKTDSQTPNLGMVMVIDRSGSMSDSRYGMTVMEMAKEAAIRGVESLNQTDSIGVVAFDSEAEWAVEFQKVGENSAAIQQSIGKIQPMGGTSILPALRIAYEKLKTADTRLKHIILLTDGQAEQEGYDGLLTGMSKNGITLSTIAVGSGADTALLERLAEKGKGRYYFTNEFTNLPEIFAKEALLAGKEYLNHRYFYPVLQDSSPILSGIDSIAQLKGYIGTTAKSRADVILKSDTDDPILAAWQYGLGRTVAWTSDMNGEWSGEWLATDQGVRLFRNMAAWTMRSQVSHNMQVTGERTDSGGKIRVAMEYNKEIKQISATVLSSDNEQYQVKLNTIAPGIYEGELPEAGEGAYIVTVLAEKMDGAIDKTNAGFHLSFSSEYDIRQFQNGKALLKKISEITEGRILTDPAEVFSQEAKQTYANKDLSNILILLSLVFFLLDIALRRFYFLSQRIETAALKWAEKWHRNIEKPVMPIKQEKQKETKIEKEVPNKKEQKEEKQNTASLLASKKKRRKK